MKSIIALSVGVAAIPQQPAFEEWAAQYGLNGDEVKATYDANVVEIDRLNNLNTTAEYGVNQFSGLSSEEFAAVYLTEREEIDNSSFPIRDHVLGGSVASSIDWVERGGVTPVKDQGSCGSCWTFGTMGVVEAVHKVQTGEEVILAEQQLLDCSGEGSCDGGSTTSALKWLKSNTPCLASSYSYSATDGHSCKSCHSSHIHVSEVTLLQKTDSALSHALNDSPVAVSLDGSQLHHYKSGVVEGKTGCHHSHSVLAVGYASDYWKIKNSWGKSWGEHGFVRVKRGGSNCGYLGLLDTNPRLPTLSGGSPSPSPSPSPPSDGRRRRRSSSSCSDVSGWRNQDGDTCSTYEHAHYCTSDGKEGSGWSHSSWGNFEDWYDSDGRTAFVACCACGGGSSNVIV